MNFCFATLLLLAFFSATNSECPAGYSKLECSRYSLVESAFFKASTEASTAIINAVLSSSARSSKIYQAALKIFEQHAAVALKTKKLSQEEADLMIKNVGDEYRYAEKAQANIVSEALEAIAYAQREVVEALQEATVQHSQMKREILDEQDFPVTKQQLKEALAKAHQKIKEIVKKAVEKVNSGLGKLEGFLERMLQRVANSKGFQSIKHKIKELIKKVVEEVAGKAEKRIQPAFDNAVENTQVLYELESDVAFMDLWSKVKDAVKKIGVKVFEITKKVLEENKEEIVAALEKLGKVLIAAGKKIAIELAGEIVKASLA